MNLRTAVTILPEPTDLLQDWAEFEPAIRRQEALSGRQAPIPTEIGPKSGRRLAVRFAEWLMWLPDGWITAVPGLSRKDQLHKIGNGVVPTQAYEAYRSLLAQAGLAQWREAA
jgi:DNA (cytosine-5)-methyltransferase 1